MSEPVHPQPDGPRLDGQEEQRLREPLAEDLQAFRATYEEMYGFVPAPPEAKLQFLGRLDPEAARLNEQLRAHAFLSDVLDPRTTQLVIFGMLVVLGLPAARFHGIAALRAGATMTELAKVVELASSVASLGPANVGSQMLAGLADFDPANPPEG